MNLSDVFHKLENINATSKQAIKKEIISQGLTDELFRKVCYYAYHPRYRFGIKPKVDDHSVVGENNPGYFHSEGDGFFGLLDQLRNWELTGNSARQAVDLWQEDLCPAAGKVLTRILRKDLKAGFTANTLNKIEKGLIPQHKTMLAHKYEKKRIKSWPVIGQPKLDGYRFNVYVDPEAASVDFLSREGNNDFCELPTLTRLILQNTDLVKPHWIDAEVTAGMFNETSSKIRTQTGSVTDAVLHVFDRLSREEFLTKSDLSHVDRRASLQASGICDEKYVILVEEKILNNDAEVWEYYHECRAKGLEGIIVKTLDGLWEPKRSYNWLKIKDEHSKDPMDLRVTAVHNGRNPGQVGSVSCEGGHIKTKVSGGISHAQKKAWFDDPDLIIGQIVEVDYHEVTPDNSLRHPRILRIRDDKTETNVES
jgi:ATP-dependent DNA ligase